MAAKSKRKQRFSLLVLIRRALGRPYLFMAAVVFFGGTVWFTRLALQEFLLIDRLRHVYTNDAQVHMRAVPIKPGITAEVREVSVQEGDTVQQGQVLVRLAQDEILAELHRAEAAVERLQHQLRTWQQETPLAIARAQKEVARAQALLEVKERAWRRAQELLAVEQDRVEKMMQEKAARLEAARAYLREQEAVLHEAAMTLQRMRSLFQDGIVSQDRLETAEMTYERAQARLAAAQQRVRQVQEHYPVRDSPHMIRVHQKELRRLRAAIKEQRAALELAQTNLRLATLRRQRLKVLTAQLKEAQAQVEAVRLKLAKTVIRSPIDGIVGYRRVEPGELVEADPSNPPILVIYDPRQLWIEAKIWESDIRRVRPGMTAEIWIDALKTSALGRGAPLRGRVLRISPATYSEVAGLPPERFFTRRERKVPVQLMLANPHPSLRAGMLAEVLIRLDGSTGAQEAYDH